VHLVRVMHTMSVESVGAGFHVEHVAAGPDEVLATSAQVRCAAQPGSEHLPIRPCQKFHQLYRPG
jgi:hypothetical protein